MAAIRPGDVDRAINHPPAGVFLYLVFGTDAGLVGERIRTILSRAVDNPKDPFQLVQMSGDEIAVTPIGMPFDRIRFVSACVVRKVDAVSWFL